MAESKSSALASHTRSLLLDVLTYLSAFSTKKEALNVYYRVGPGHLDLKKFEILSLQPDLLTDELKDRLIDLGSKFQNESGLKFELDLSSDKKHPWTRDFSESILLTVKHLWRKSNAIVRTIELESNEGSKADLQQVVDVEALESARDMTSWVYDPEARTRYAEVTFTPRIGFDHGTILGKHWHSERISLLDACIQRQGLFELDEQYLHRALDCERFFFNITDFQGNESALSEKIDEFRLACSLSVHIPLHTLEVRIRKSPWPYAPGVEKLLWSSPPPIGQSPLVSMNLRFWASLAPETEESFAPRMWENAKSVCVERVRKWRSYLKTNERNIFALHLIVEGNSQLLSSKSAPSYRQNLLALQGLFLTLAGLESLSRGAEGDWSTKRFINYWEPIWRARLKNVGDENLLKQCNHIRSCLGHILKLRNSLAHGDRESLKSNLKEVKISIGDCFNQEDYSAYSLALCISKVSFQLLEQILDDSSS